MDAFGVEDGSGGTGTARYAAGLITLPDGTTRGVETLLRIEPADPTGFRSGAERAGAVAGSVRDVLGTGRSLALPLRLALSTVRAGLGAIEEGLRPAERVPHTLVFADGSTVLALLPPELVVLLRRDAEIARGVLARAALPLPSSEGDAAAGEALTSIFRYEKRNGRLRRIAPGKPET